MSDPNEPKPFAPPYVLNSSSVTIQNGEEVWPMSAPPPRPPRKRPWLATVVIVGVVALVGGLVVAGLAEYQAIAGRVSQADNGSFIGVPDAPPDSDHIPTEPPTTAAVDCPPTCFTVEVAGLLVPNNSLQASMPVGQPVAFADFQNPTTAAAEYADDARLWAILKEPDSCFFIYPLSPVGPTYGGPDSTSQDPVTFLGETSDKSGGTTLTQNARFFPTSVAATAYMRSVRDEQMVCQNNDHSIVATPSFAVNEGMDINAFTQLRSGERTYVYDIQRANVVVRFQVVSQDSVDEPAVVHFINTWMTTTFAPLDPE
ncbi:MAG TPA: hypothetical protein VGM70_11090 [Pseudolysinimonas sp.]